MKKVLFLFSMMLGSAAIVCAQDSTSVQDQPSTEYRTDESTQDEATSDDGALQDQGLTQDTTSQGMGQDESMNQDQTGASGSEQPGLGSEQEGSTSSSSDYTDKEMISTAELPSLVTEQLQSDEYSGWMIDRSYRKEKDGKTFYAVELKNGSETKMVKFDEQGNKVKEKDKSEEHNKQ